MTIAIKPTASGSTIEQNGSTILTVDSSGNIDVANNLTVTGSSPIPSVPAFSAYQSDQSISSATVTKMQFDTEDFDTASCYDTTTYRFTPNVAGYYQFNVTVKSDAGATRFLVYFYKNGALYKRLFDTQMTYNRIMPGSVLVYLNGSTDYVEVYGYRDGSTGNTNATVSSHSHFQGYLVSV